MRLFFFLTYLFKERKGNLIFIAISIQQDLIVPKPNTLFHQILSFIKSEPITKPYSDKLYFTENLKT